jgi:putative hemolysin
LSSVALPALLKVAGNAVHISLNPSPPAAAPFLRLSQIRRRSAAGSSPARSPLVTLRLRFEVFNLELGEGPDSSFATGRDQDEFDLTCHHLIVEHRESGRIVGTYRLQTPQMACGPEGLYTAREYDLAMMPDEILRHSVEVGRACIAREHRGRQTIDFLVLLDVAALTPRAHRMFFG